MEFNIIFFIGPQGSGKGTQAKILAQRLDFFYWEMGGILREVAQQPTDLGKEIKNQIDQGILLSDETLYKVVKQKLTEISKVKGVIFDGIPRRLGQAEFIINYLKEEGRGVFTTIYVTLPKEESISRLLKRADLEKRADDTLEKIEFRLSQYIADTLPVVEYLKQCTNFVEIDGRPSVDEVMKAINSALKLA